MTCPDRDYSQTELKKQLAREMREVKILQGLDHVSGRGPIHGTLLMLIAQYNPPREGLPL